MANGCTNKILSEDYADFMIDEGKALEDLSMIPNTCTLKLIENTYNVYIPINNIPNKFIQTYGYGAYPNCYGLMDINSLDVSGISKIQNIPALPLKGEGVLIGIVDTGIDYRHESFVKQDGTTKVYSIWDQTIDVELLHPDRFPFGSEYTKDKINQALASENPLSLVPSIDENGHGTFLAGIVAGNRNDKENFSGVVPDSEIVVVKLKQAKQYLKEFWRIPNDTVVYQKNDLIMGIDYLKEIADKVKRPISILIGIGTSQGAHDERGVLSRYLSSLATKQDVCISIAGGNEGNTGHHYMGKVEGNPNLVQLMVGPDVSGFSMEIWGSTPTNFSIDIKSPSGEYIPRIPPRLNESREIGFIFEKTVINLDYQLVEAQSGEQLILLRFFSPTQGIWSFQVYASESKTFSYHCWLPIEKFLSSETHFIEPNPEYTLTSPGNTFIPIVTTAYNSVNQNLYLNASRGYMRNDNIAPSFAAPGVDLIGPNLSGGYKTSSGTSIAAAHTAGVGAILLEWGIVKGNYPNISTVEIRNILIRGTKREPTITYPNKEWGYGKLDLYNSYNVLRGTSLT